MNSFFTTNPESKFLSLVKTVATIVLLVSLTTASFASPEESRNNDNCRRMTLLTDDDMKVISARSIAKTADLPAHCRVTGSILPAVNFEVNLPFEWNGKFLMVGNGGYLGSIFDQSYGLSRGYATASTDTGHQGGSPEFGLNNRQAEIDFGYRAIQVSTGAAKNIITSFYDRPPRYSYFRGCSNGGRSGLMEAQRFPDDYDGMSIGAPLYDLTAKQTYNAGWVTQALFGNGGAGYVPPSKLKALGTAVYEQCDAIDGLKDALIDDPRNCQFDPHRDLTHCPAGKDSDSCFTAAQIEAIRKIYDGPGNGVYPGAVKGGEWMSDESTGGTGGWDWYFTGRVVPDDSEELRRVPENNKIGDDAYGGVLDEKFQSVQYRNSISFFKYLAFENDDPGYEFLRDFDFSNPADTSYMASILDATDPDLRAFEKHGGKILMWHGWADMGLNPLSTIKYYKQVQQLMGEEKTNGFLQLFMLPGVYHCVGGPGADLFDDLTALEQWVENGTVPGRIIASRLKDALSWDEVYDRRKNVYEKPVQFSRPLCAYPKVSRYQGSGSIWQAGNFACVDPD